MFAIRLLKKNELRWEPLAVSTDKEMLRQKPQKNIYFSGSGLSSFVILQFLWHNSATSGHKHWAWKKKTK